MWNRVIIFEQFSLKEEEKTLLAYIIISWEKLYDNTIFLTYTYVCQQWNEKGNCKVIRNTQHANYLTHGKTYIFSKYMWVMLELRKQNLIFRIIAYSLSMFWPCYGIWKCLRGTLCFSNYSWHVLKSSLSFRLKLNN